MGLDINLFRKEKGGNPDLIRESEKKRFRDKEGMQNVEQVIVLDKIWRKKNFDKDLIAQKVNQLQK